jgi:hypothetical protein
MFKENEVLEWKDIGEACKIWYVRAERTKNCSEVTKRDCGFEKGKRDNIWASLKSTG